MSGTENGPGERRSLAGPATLAGGVANGLLICGGITDGGKAVSEVVRPWQRWAIRMSTDDDCLLRLRFGLACWQAVGLPQHLGLACEEQHDDVADFLLQQLGCWEAART